MDYPLTLITAAVTTEVAPLVKRLGLRRDTAVADTIVYSHPQKPCVVVLTGIGHYHAVRVCEWMLSQYKPQRVFITGFAGGTDPAYCVGEVIVPEFVIDGLSGDKLVPKLPHKTWRSLYTGAVLAQSPRAKRMIYEDHHAGAVDMESAAIARCCDQANVPWLCVRAISDTAGETLPPFMLKLTDTMGRPRYAAAVFYALSHPRHIGSMVRIGSNAKRAARMLASWVGPLIESNVK